MDTPNGLPGVNVQQLVVVEGGRAHEAVQTLSLKMVDKPVSNRVWGKRTNMLIAARSFVLVSK